MSSRIVDTTAEGPRCSSVFPVLEELRAHPTEGLLHEILIESEPQGLRFTGIFGRIRCVAIAGWRVVAGSHAVRRCHIDDRFTTADAPSREGGYHLFHELTRRTREFGRDVLDPDSRFQRHDALCFYVREGTRIGSRHFPLPLGQA